jgi:hypothetical protein
MMHKMICLAFLSTALLLGTACEDDGGPQQGVSYNSYDIGGQNYDTYSGALIFDKGPIFSDGYAFSFQNGDIAYTAANGVTIEAIATNAIVLFVENSAAVFNDCADIPITTGTFSVTDDSRALYDIVQYNNTHSYCGLTYGTPDEPTSNRLEVNNTGSGSLTINSISIDYAREEAQVDLIYTITDGTTTLTGQFDGRVDILKGF